MAWAPWGLAWLRWACWLVGLLSSLLLSQGVSTDVFMLFPLVETSEKEQLVMRTLPF